MQHHQPKEHLDQSIYGISPTFLTPKESKTYLQQKLHQSATTFKWATR